MESDGDRNRRLLHRRRAAMTREQRKHKSMKITKKAIRSFNLLDPIKIDVEPLISIESKHRNLFSESDELYPQEPFRDRQSLQPVK